MIHSLSNTLMLYLTAPLIDIAYMHVNFIRFKIGKFTIYTPPLPTQIRNLAPLIDQLRIMQYSSLFWFQF